MKQHKIRNIAWMTALLLILLVCSACEQQTDNPSETPGSTEQPICYFVDTNKQRINGWYSEGEGQWYLFVPGKEDLSSLTLYVDDTVTETSAGVLDSQAGTITNPFAETNELTLTCNGTPIQVVAKQSDLPSLHIVLDKVTLDEVHMDKDVKFAGNSIYLSDPAGTYDLTAENCVEIKGRGNSSWSNYEKKGYQLEFSEQTSLMGMNKAQRWILLANASDDSMMRTQLVYQMAKQMDMAFVPTFEYVDLWVNGEYRGTYILGEKVELDSNRLHLESYLGGLYEHDEAFFSEDEYWVFSEQLGRHFVLKDAVVDSDAAVINAAMVDFQSAVDELAKYLYATPATQITLDDLSTMIDVDSFVLYYLINEFSLNRESFATSFYWYKDGVDDVLHLGPIWDFDTCMGNDGAGYAENYGDNHVLFKYLLSIPQFRQRVAQLQEAYWPDLTGMADQIDILYDEIDTSAELNYLRWNVLGKPNPKGGTDFNATFDEAVSALKTWLQNRAEQFSVPETRTLAASVNNNCTAMDLYYTGNAEHTGVRFAVWSLAAGQQNLQWYTAEQDEAGGWFCTVDLSTHNSAGLYSIDVYPDNSPTSVASGRCHVKYAVAPTAWIEATLSEDGETLRLLFQDSKKNHSWIRLAVWSAEGEQDDLIWYDAGNIQGKRWRTVVDLNDHSGTGTYHINAFSADGLLATQTVYVPRGDGSTTLFADLEGDGQTLKLTLENAPDTLSEVRFAVWCNRGGQDDLIWYDATYSGSVWETRVNVSHHGGAGKFVIHAYDGTDANKPLLADTIAYVYPQEEGAPELTVTHNQIGTTLTVTLLHAGQYDKIWFPIWNAAGNQEDLVWYDGIWQNDGTWSCTVPVSNLTTYAIQAYTGDAGPTDALAETIIHVEGSLPEITDARLETVLSEDGQNLTLRLLGAEQTSRVWIPLWSEENAQDDIVWYVPTLDSNGVWTCTVNLADHGSTGTFHIHVYHGLDEPTVELTATATEIP